MPRRSCANCLLATYTLRILNTRDLRPKFRRLIGLDTIMLQITTVMAPTPGVFSRPRPDGQFH